jgi:hypothetical protein
MNCSPDTASVVSPRKSRKRHEDGRTAGRTGLAALRQAAPRLRSVRVPYDGVRPPLTGAEHGGGMSRGNGNESGWRTGATQAAGSLAALPAQCAIDCGHVPCETAAGGSQRGVSVREGNAGFGPDAVAESSRFHRSCRAQRPAAGLPRGRTAGGRRRLDRRYTCDTGAFVARVRRPPALACGSRFRTGERGQQGAGAGSRRHRRLAERG